jgi:hypothetical protein
VKFEARLAARSAVQTESALIPVHPESRRGPDRELTGAELPLLKATSAAGLGLGRFPLVAAIVSVGLMLCSAIDALSRATMDPSIWFFWLGIAVIVAPVIYRLCSAEATVLERVLLVALMGLSLYAVKLMHEPFGYTMPDEFFHAHNAAQIAATHRLFGADSLLAISSRYPGLEGATSALMLMTGMSSFGAGLIVIGAARLMLMLGLFVLFAQLSGSYRVAGLGAAAYAGNSNFLYFDAMFSYESLALALLAVVLAALAVRSHASPTLRREWTIPLLLAIAAIVITHHLTSYLMDAVLVTLGLLPLLSRGRLTRMRTWPFAAVGLALTLTWLVVVASETVGYITPVVTSAFHETLKTVLGEAAPRAPFQGGTGGGGTPLPEKLVAFGALAILAAALPFGLLSVWRRHRRNPLAILLCIAALGFFAVLGLRFSASAWEIANRLDEFLFMGLAFVVGYGVTDRLALKPSRRLPGIVAACAVIVVVGGAITGWPVDEVLAPAVRIATSGHASDSETIALGRWVRNNLGAGAGFAAPEADARTILLYGDGRVYTGYTADIRTLLTTPGTSTSQLTKQLNRLHRLGVRYVVVDLRRRGDDDATGYAFSLHPPGGRRDHLLSTQVALKFDDLPAPRVYDSGDVLVYDLSAGR